MLSCKTKSMKGRVFNIKKTTILKLSFVFNAFMSLGLSVFSLSLNGANDDYFFIVCVFLGVHIILKAILFKLDSSCYFGVALFCLGIFYFYSENLLLQPCYPVFLVLAFATASFVVHCCFDRPIHLNVAISLFFASIFTFLFIIKWISLAVFLAFLGGTVLLLSIRLFIF